MRFGCSQGRALVWCDGTWADVERESSGRFGPHPASVLERWEDFRGWADSLCGPVEPAPEGPWDPPSPTPRQVIAIGANYAAHAEEVGLAVDDQVSAFGKFSSCLRGSGCVVELPSRFVDWEVELVVVMGRLARNVQVASAWDYVAGLTVGQDLTDRHVQLAAPARQFSLAKSFPGAGVVGPFLVTPDEFAHRDDLALGCAFAGETVQESRTSLMRKSVPELVSELSAHVELLPGDLIFTGSPAGSGHAQDPPCYLTAGHLSSWVEGVGVLEVSFRGPLPS